MVTLLTSYIVLNHGVLYSIFINQAKYAQEILKNHGMTSCDIVGTPMATKPLDANLSGNPVDQTKYRSMVEALMYLTPSRSDIVHATCYCARYQARLTEKHPREVKRIFRYLMNTINMGLWYPKDTGFNLTAFSDSNHAGYLDTRKSTSGGIQFLGGDKLVSWSSKNKWRARLGDFGLALRGHVENDAKMRCTPPAGTLGYLDPCYLAPCDLTVKSDVFSFGILMLEIFSGRHAIDLRFSPPSVVDWAVPFIRSGEYHEVFDRNMNISRGSEAVVRQLAVLAAMCVKPTADKRPEMAEVVESLVKVTKTGWRVIKVTRQPVSEYKILTNVPRVESSDGSGGGGGEKIGGHVARSKSIGGVSEVECRPLDRNKDVQGLCGIMRRSKSTGELQESKWVNRRNGGGIVLQMIRNPNVRELESAKLLVKFS
ncbi:uncharacterized mitochondrial protein-like protein [Tanacetum coccineum]